MIGRARVLVFAVALVAYLPGFWWGAPHATAADRVKSWSVDDEPPLGPLAQLHDLVTPGIAPNRNLGYPMLHSFLVLGAYAPYLAVRAATGGLSAPSGEYPFGLSDPVTALRHLSWIAHLLSVLLGAGIVLAAFECGRLLWGTRDGWWAAVFGLLSYPMFYYARTSNVDVPVLFFTAWALVAFTACLVHGASRRRVIAFGALTGLAMATKEPALASFLGLPFVLLVTPHGVRPAGSVVLSRLGIASVGLGSAFLAYALGSGMVVDPGRWWAHVGFAAQRTADVSTGEIAFAVAYPWTLEGHLALGWRIVRRLADAMTAPGLALGVIGCGLALRRSARWTGWLLLSAGTYLAVLFLTARTVQIRYLMPAAFVLAVYAGHAAAAAAGLRVPAIRVALRGLAAATVLLALAWGTDLTYAMIRDSRLDAAAWFEATAKPGDRYEYFGSAQKNPPLPARVESGLAVEYLGGMVVAPRDSQTVARIFDGWAARRPRFISLIPDYTSYPGEPFAASCPPAVYDALERGAIGYVRVRHFETPALLPWAKRPPLDYPTVNPPIRIYVPATDSALATAP